MTCCTELRQRVPAGTQPPQVSLTSSQLLVQGLDTVQVFWVPETQAPFWQESPLVQKSPSSQPKPLGRLLWVQRSFCSSQASRVQGVGVVAVAHPAAGAGAGQAVVAHGAEHPVVAGRAVGPGAGLDVGHIGDGVVRRGDVAAKHAVSSIGLFDVRDASPAELAARLKSFGATLKECEERRLCLQELGTALRARYLLQVRAARTLDGVTVTVLSFDAASGLLLGRESEFVAGETADPGPAVRKLALKALAGVVTPLLAGMGRLVIEGGAEGLEILSDGRPLAALAGGEFELPAGVRQILVKKSGFLPFEDMVLVRGGGKVVLRPVFELDPAARAPSMAPLKIPEPIEKGKPVNAPPPPREEKRFYQTWWFWTMVGSVVLAAAGAAVVLGLKGGASPGQGGFSVGWE